MTKPILGIFTAFAAVLLLQPGCATNRSVHERDGGAIVARELVKSTRSWDGELLPAYPSGQPEVTIKRILIPAGARLESHTHPVINAGVLVSGELTVVAVDGKTLRLKAGDPIVELVNKSHFGINEGQVPAEIIVVYAGTAGAPIAVTDPK